MKKNSNRPTKAIAKVEEDPWIDVHDHDLMVSLGIQQPYYEGRDSSVWSKTSEEKEKLKAIKARCTTILPTNWPYLERRSPFFAKLIVRIRPCNKFKIKDKHGNEHKKTYFSHKSVCLSDIPTVLAQYYVWKDKARQSLVISYVWNGKTYNYPDLPNIRWK